MRARYLGILGVILASMIGLGAATTFVGPGPGDGTADSAALAGTAPATTGAVETTDGSATETATATSTTADPTATETTMAEPATTTATASGGDSGGDTGGESTGDGDGGTDGGGQTSAVATSTATATSSGTTTTSHSSTSATSTTDTQSTETSTTDSSRDCLANPYDYDEEDAYEYDEYGLGMPDRFAEDVLETDGVAALYYGMEGYQGGLAHYAAPEAGADPAVYCEVGGPEAYVYTDPALAEEQFTPTSARWTADPSYERGMGISDQSVRWLLGQDHVERVEYAQSCTAPDAPCAGSVTVYVRGQYPPPEDEYAKQLPDRIDGHDVTYESVDGDA